MKSIVGYPSLGELNNWWLVGFVWIAIAQPVDAGINANTEPLDRSKMTLTEQLTQGAQFTSQITDIQLQSTEIGLELILVSTEPLPSPSSSVVGDALVLDIPEAALNLPEGNEFQVANPVEGIALVTVIPDDTSVRITITGLNTIPTADITAEAERLVLNVSTDIADAVPGVESEADTLLLIVTAERTPEDVQDVPISITALTEATIEDANITSLDGIAANTPNFSTFSYGGSRNNLNYSLRGLSNFNFIGRDTVAFYVDDVPYDGGTFLNIDLIDLERVEVLRGPQSTLYGRNAQAGVVNILTRRPTNQFEFRGNASYGRFDDFDSSVSVSGPIVEDRLFYRLSGSYGRRDGYVENIILDEDLDEQSGWTGRGQLLWTPSDRWEVLLNAGFENYDDGAPPLVILGRDPFEVEQNVNGFSDLSSDIQSLRVVHTSPEIRVTAITARRNSDAEFDVDSDFSTADIFRRVTEFETNLFSQELRIQSPEDAEQFQWLVGGYYESRDVGVNDEGFIFGTDAAALVGAPPGSNFLTTRINETIWAGFSQVSYRPTTPLTLTAGLRYESSSAELESQERIFTPADGSAAFPSGATFSGIEQDGEEWLPRFAVEYQLSPNLMAYGSIARGYKPPGVNARADSEQTVTFEAERSWNYEIGLKSSWFDDRLIGNLAIFHNPVDNYQLPIPDTNGLFRGVANADVRITGAELEIRATPADGLDLIAGLGIVDTEVRNYTNPLTGESFEGNRLPFAPDLTYNVAAQYRSPSGIFGRVELVGFGTTYFDDANQIQQGDFAILNARLGYEFDNTGIYLFANNLLDNQYLINGFAFPPLGDVVMYGAPATYGIQVRTRL